MKKTFTIIESKKAPARQVDGFKHEIKKYIARERRKDLPEGSDFWDFNCKFGANESALSVIHLTEINSSIDKLIAAGQTEFCLEVMAVAKTRKSKS